MARITIDPVSRISGLLEIDAEIENNKIIEAKSSGMQFRGFEEILKGRFPLDAIYLVSRVCGICSVHHSIVSSMALENALGITPDTNGDLIRNLANGFEFLQNHIRHTYQLVFPDYVYLGEINPLYKHIDSESADYRIPKNINDMLANHYLESLSYSRKTHKAVAILGGKAPHAHGIFVGGTTTNMDIQKYQEVKVILYEVKKFIEEKLIPDIYIISNYYPDYFKKGKGYDNLMDYGLYYKDIFPVKYTYPGVIINRKKEEIDISKISEDVKYTWVDNLGQINENKSEAYSWINAARYKEYPMEVGPLARMIIGGYYKYSISVMDRIIARGLECKKICECLEGIIDKVRLQPAYQKSWEIPDKASGFAVLGATRGSLGHWLEIENKVIKNYTIITPSTWNLSPKDSKGVRGPVEQALTNTYIDNIKKAPTIIGRIVRSFDPCSNCASHITSDNNSPITIRII